jgi:hypothetical protein
VYTPASLGPATICASIERTISPTSSSVTASANTTRSTGPRVCSACVVKVVKRGSINVVRDCHHSVPNNAAIVMPWMPAAIGSQRDQRMMRRGMSPTGAESATTLPRGGAPASMRCMSF